VVTAGRPRSPWLVPGFLPLTIDPPGPDARDRLAWRHDLFGHESRGEKNGWGLFQSRVRSVDEVRNMGEPEQFEPEMPGDTTALKADDEDEVVTEDDGVDAGDDDVTGVGNE
jgi:hypothetical protein